MDDDNLNIGLIGLFVGIVAVIFLVLAIISSVLVLAITSGDQTGVVSPAAGESAPVHEAGASTPDAYETEASEKREHAVPIVYDGSQPIQLPTVTPPESNEPVNRLVVVTADNQLLTVAPDGSDIITLTEASDGISYLFPAWSPDSRNIAAIGATRNRTRSSGIFIFENSAETTPTQIHTQSEVPIYLYWSPDSSEVSFITTRVADSSLLDLRVVPRDGSDRSRFLAFGQPFYWDYSSTGDEIIISTERSTHAKFAYISPSDGTISEPIAEVSRYFQSPDLSFDDAYLAYAVGDEETRRVVIINRESNEQQSAEHFGYAALSWSPVSNALAFTSATRNIPSAVGPLKLLTPDGTRQTLVDDDVFGFFWSPDGSKIAYLTVGGIDTNQEATWNRTRRALHANQQQANPYFLLWLLDMASSERMLLGSFVSSQPFFSQFLPFFDQYAHSHTIWSPNSDAIALPLLDENGDSVIYRFTIDGAHPTLIMRGQVAFWSRR